MRPRTDAYLAEKGLKSSKRRSAVLKALESAKKHLTVDELYDEAIKVDPKVGYTTVWRTLKLLASLGLVSAQKFGDGNTRYELLEGESHHDHLICIKCGRVEEFLNHTIEEIQAKVAAKHNFRIVSHRMEIYGYCEKCRKKN